MSNTIFHGVSELPKRFIKIPTVTWQETEIDIDKYKEQLFQEIEQRHEVEILARPYAYNWGLVTEGDEYAVGILVSRLPDKLSSEDLEKLNKPIGGLKVLLSFSDGELIGHG